MSATSTVEAPLAAPTTEEVKGGKKKLVMIVAVLAVVGAAAYFFLLAPSAAAPAEPAEPVPGEVVEVGQMTVNLADPGRYARVSFSVVLVEGAVPSEAAAKFPLLKEAVLFEVSNVASADLRAPGGLDAIAERLSARARELYDDGSVLRVVLTELLVQ